MATVLPESFTTGPMRALPILLLFGTMFYWLWRVRDPLQVACARPARVSDTFHARDVKRYAASGATSPHGQQQADTDAARLL